MTQGKEFSQKMLSIIRAAQYLKRHAYDCPPSELAKLQMQSLTIFTQEAKEIMDVIQLNGDDAVQGVLLDLDPEVQTMGKVIINNEEEDKEKNKS